MLYLRLTPLLLISAFILTNLILAPQVSAQEPMAFGEINAAGNVKILSSTGQWVEMKGVYPLLKETIAATVGDGVRLVDSAEETARTVAEILKDSGLTRPESEKGNHHYFVTDVPAGFIRVGNRFLGGALEDVHQISLET